MKIVPLLFALLFVGCFFNGCVDQPYAVDENDPHPPAPYSPDPTSHITPVQPDPLGNPYGRY